jgi:hypothetical protein
MTADDLRIPSAANAVTASAPLAANLSFPACPGQSRPARVVPGRSRGVPTAHARSPPAQRTSAVPKLAAGAQAGSHRSATDKPEPCWSPDPAHAQQAWLPSQTAAAPTIRRSPPASASRSRHAPSQPPRPPVKEVLRRPHETAGMTGRLPRCSQHESPGQSGGVPLEYSIGWVTCTVGRHDGRSGGWLAGCCSRSFTC